MVIYWFRQDLRLSDNPALYEAVQYGKVLPIYIFDSESASEYAMGAASRLWLHHSLLSLNKDLGNRLSIYKGKPLTILQDLQSRYAVKKIFWNRCYEPWRIKRDTHIKKQLQKQGVSIHSYNGSLLWEPWKIMKKDGTPYRVFTPFYRKGCLNSAQPRKPLPVPEQINLYKDEQASLHVDDLMLLPSLCWDGKILSHWNIGEDGARNRMEVFLQTGIHHYKKGRDMPAEPYVSRLSPHLHFGEISPNQVWYALKRCGDNQHADHFCSELGWREFSYSQLYFNPELPRKNLQNKFNNFPWKYDAQKLEAWQKGQTGIPMIDAGMRELWQTGYMHNRLRMIVGSFLVKNLLLHWHYGESWFWDCLLDADLASNSAGWQWIAGCGADAVPYFRIFNPVLQGKKFDPEGNYTRRYIPELNKVPNEYLFNPWEAPDTVLDKAGVLLGKNYPKPIVDIKKSRQEAIKAYKSLSM